MSSSTENIAKNKDHYDRLYSTVAVGALTQKVRQLDAFLSDAVATDTSWHGLYAGGLQKRMAGSNVLEIGAGDGLNALVMAALGANVLAVDISGAAFGSLEKAAVELGLKSRLSVHEGDFLAMDWLAPGSYDFVIGKAFLHHLDHQLEAVFLRKIAEILSPRGEARFIEPATNSPLLDRLRFMTPVPGRPSSFNREAFAAWLAMDPHPVRDNSSNHFHEAMSREFHDVEIQCLGTLERFHRILPKGRWVRPYRRWAFRAEEQLPQGLNRFFARSQMISGRNPRHASGITSRSGG